MILKAQKSPRKCIPLSILKIIVIFAFLTLCKQSNAFSLQNVKKHRALFLFYFSDSSVLRIVFIASIFLFISINSNIFFVETLITSSMMAPITLA